MSRDDFSLNSPKDPWSPWEIPSPQPFLGFDDYDITSNFSFTDLPIPNSPILDFDSPPPFQPTLQPQIQAMQPPSPEKKVISQPPVHSRHRRTPSMPVRAAPILDFPLNTSPLERFKNTATSSQFTPQSLQSNMSTPQQLPPSHTRTSSMPDTAITIDDSFTKLCKDPSIKFNPAKLGFIPSKNWNDEELTFGDIVSQFFQKKNNANSRFSHKLYNALKITDSDHFYYIFLGVEWVTDKILKVDKRQFARLLGIRTIDGSFFHQQGNFPSHGFVELTPSQAQTQLDPKDLEGVDYDNVRLLTHQEGIFIRGCTEDVLESCRWVSTKKRTPT